jgi:hypothetical protein
MSPLVLIQRSAGSRSARMSLPAGVVARTLLARETISSTLVLMRSTARKSARMPSRMICGVMFTMCPCRMRRRFTMSVSSIRDPSSFAWARAAKMLTWLRSMAAATTAGRPESGRGATRSSTKHSYGAPTASISCTSAPAISAQASSVMSVTRSAGWMLRQTRTALRAPGSRSWSTAVRSVIRQRPTFVSSIMH